MPSLRRVAALLVAVLLPLAPTAVAAAPTAPVAVPAAAGTGAGIPEAAPARVASVLDAQRTGVASPSGLAYSARSKAFSVLGARDAAHSGADTPVTGLSSFGRKAWSARLPGALSNPLAFAVDDAHHRLLALRDSRRLVSVPQAADGTWQVAGSSVADVGSLSLGDLAGMTVDDRGDVYLLDSTGPRLVRLRPQSDGSLANAQVATTPLAWLSGATVRGLAFDPQSKNLYVLSPSDRQVYEMAPGGDPVAVHDISGVSLRDPQGIVVAPTADQTDPASATSLYVADTGGTAAGTGQVVEMSFTAAATAQSSDYASTLVNTVDMANVTPPSPDPSGLAYQPESGRLFLTDGEVEETVNGITHFRGASEWELSPAGSVLRTANLSKIAPATVKMTNEPTGIAWNRNTGHWFVTDDDAQRVYNLDPGSDKLIGTADDTFTYFSTLGANDGDPEGVTYDPVHDRVFTADGVNQEIYEWTPSGALVNHFDVRAYGVLDPESVEYLEDSDTLAVLSNHGNRIIVETSRNGAYIRTIDVSAANAIAPAGLAYAPSSNDPKAHSYYIVDRAVDNNDDPNIVDGKIFEVSAPAALTPGNTPPATEAGPDLDVVLPGVAHLDGTVVDDGLPDPPGAVTTTWSQTGGPSTATIADASAVDTTVSFPIPGQYALQLTAYDGQATVTDDVVVNVTGHSTIVPVDARVAASADDAEEQTNGSMSMTSAKLDMMLDIGTTTNTNAMVGMRFRSLGIPSGAKITNAYLQYTAAQVQTGPMTLTLRAQAADDAQALTSARFSLSSRTPTSASTTWEVPSWLQVNDSGSAQRSPDLTPAVQEVVDRAGWTTTSALALLVTGAGSGIRVARSYDGSPLQAPLLHVEYDSGALVNSAPTVAIDQPGTDATVNEGDPVTFAATAWDNEDGDVGPSVVWTSSIDGQIGTGPSVAVSTLSPGTHTVTATATDSAGSTASASRTVKVFAPAPVLVGAGDIADCTEPGDEATAKLLDVTPGTVFTVGDNVYEDGTADQFKNCYDPTWGRHRLRTRPTPGNHDYHVPNAADYYAYFGDAAGPSGLGYYSYDVAGWHVIALNSEISTSAGSVQEKWLRADLAAHPAVCTVAIFHRPRFSSGVLHGSEPSMQPFWQALYDYGADVVLSGHEHNYERFAPQTPGGVADSARGIREFVIGTGGAAESGYSFGTPLANSEVRATDAIGVLKLTLSPMGYDWTFLGVPGTSFSDSGHGDCVGANANVNAAPVVDAGADQTVTLPDGAELAGSVRDDGLPAGASVTSVWTKVDGPGTVTFADASKPATSATFSTAGSYRLRLTADDTALSSSSDVVVTVNPAGTANSAPTVDAGPDRSVTMPDAASLAGVAIDDGLPAGSSLSVEWSKVSGPGSVSFADPTDASTTAAFDTAGSYVLRLTATDGDLSSSDTVSVSVAAAGGGGGGGTPVTVQAVVASASDDAEERSGNSVDLGSTDLELVTDGSVVQTVGVRFGGVAVPQGAQVTAASIQFQDDEVSTDATSLTIRGQAADDAATFTSTTANVSGRPRTSASTGWVPPAWNTRDERGPAQRTPDLSAVVQEVVNRSGWASGHAMAFVITGSGRRTAESFEGGAPAVLEVTYVTDGSGGGGGGGGSTNTAPVVDAGPDRSVTMPDAASLAGVATDDGLPAGGSLAVQWSKTSGPGTVTFADPTDPSTTATFDTAGSYVLRLTATDGDLSSNDTISVSVNPAGAVNSAPTVAIDQPGTDATVNEGDPVTFAATAWDNEDGDVGPSVVWTSSIDGQIGTGPSVAVSTLSPGTHTVTATATDSAGSTASASRTVKVFAPAPVLVGAGDIADCTEPGDEATAKLLDVTPGTVFTVGDNVYEDGTADQFKNCYDPTWGRHRLRTRPTPGNHDYHVPNAADYYAYFGDAAGPSGLGYYSYDVAGWHVIALNSEISTSAGSVQEKWLRADLAAHPAVCTVAIFHRPRFSSGVLHGSEPSMQPFWQALYDYGADVVLSGHEHNYERFAPQTPGGVADSARGIREFVIGTGGAAESGYSFGTPLANSEVRATDAIGVLKLTLSPMGYDWTFLGVPGTSFSDSGHGDCVGANANVNAAPVVDAGADQTVTLPDGAELAGSVRDDGLPAGASVTSVWTKVDGPGTVTFADASKPATSATFSTAGSYRLRLTADDTALSSSSDVVVTVNPAGTANSAPTVDAGPDRSVTMPDAASLAGVAIDDGLPAGSSLSVEWSKVSGPGSVSFADPTDASTTAAFDTAGSYVLRLTATDGDLSSSDTVSVSVAAAGGGGGGGTPVTVQAVVASASDDAEERSGNSVDLGSTDLELVTDGSVVQTVGVRFGGVAVPQGAQVTAASIQFQDDEVSTDATSLTIRGQAADDAATFTSTTANVSGRPRTSASTGWVPPAWNTRDERGPAQRTPDLSAVVQEVVNRSGWASGHAMAFVITGSGRRTAESFEGGAPAVLEVTYVTDGSGGGGGGGGSTNTAPVVDAGPDRSVTMPDAASLAGVATDDGLPAGGSLAVQWSKTSGPGTVTFADPTDPSTTATFDTAGSYVLRLTATDGDLSSNDTISVTVTAASGGGGGGGSGTVTVQAPVASNSDDAEERSGSSVDLGSTDLELVTDGSVVQTVGMRFAALDVPAGAIIEKAWIQFSTDELTTGAASLTLRAQAADDAATFTSTTGNVSGRPRTAASTSWTPLAWSTVNERGAAQQTPDLSAVLQEVVSRPGWQSGHATVFVVTGTGTRTAISHEKSATAAPLLHVEYRMP